MSHTVREVSWLTYKRNEINSIVIILLNILIVDILGNLKKHEM